jgi:hypothetical protein
MNTQMNKEILTAVMAGQFDKLETLLPQADLNTVWMFLQAVKNDDAAIKLANAIIKQGGNIKSKEAIFSALSRPAVLQMALDNGADPNAQWDAGGILLPGTTPLLRATDGGILKSVEFLIKAGADVNYRDRSGGSALLYACDHGHKEIVELLIDSGADVDVVDKKGRTPLELAKGKANLKADASLLKKLEGKQVLETLKTKFVVTPISEEVISKLPDTLTKHAKFIDWLKKTGMIKGTKGSQEILSIDPEEYSSQMEALVSWTDDKSFLKYVPVAGPGADDWCIVYNLEDNQLYEWWHEESSRFKPFNKNSLEEVIREKLELQK